MQSKTFSKIFELKQFKMDLLLIETVKKHPILYDTPSYSHLDHGVRQEMKLGAWVQVGQDVNISPEIAKEKWNKLRRCFWNATNRWQNKKTGQPVKKTILWKYEQKMSFLLPFLQPRVRSSVEGSESKILQNNIMTDLNKHYEDEENENPTNDMENKITSPFLTYELLKQTSAENNFNENDKPIPQIGIVEENGIKIENFENYCESKESLERTKKKSKINSSTQKMIEIVKENSKLRKAKYECKFTQPKSNCCTHLDETDMFFLSMGRMTKQLPRCEQSKIKLMLSNAVFKADIQIQESQDELYSEQSPYARPSCTFSFTSSNSDNSL